MSQGDSSNWNSAVGSETAASKLNGNSGDSILSGENRETAMSDQSVPNLTFNLPKKLDDSAESTNELPNGHKSKTVGDLLEETEELPDTVLISPTKEPSKDKSEEELSEFSQADSDRTLKHEDKRETNPGKSSLKIEESQDMFESTAERAKSPRDEELKESAGTKDVKESQILKLEVSESQLIKDDDSQSDSMKVDDKEERDGEGDEISENGAEPPGASPGQSAEGSTTPSENVATPSGKQSAPPSQAEPCTCDPSCHTRVRSISERLSNVCKHLDDFIKLKRRTENSDLTNLLSVLTSIEAIAENKTHSADFHDPDEVFYGEHPSRKKGNPRSRYSNSTPLKIVEKTPRKVETPKPQPPKKVDFKTVKGLAVFAKWPNSGWYYPGVVEGLTSSDWKESTNVTVTFYDGLVREMKNINILPASLIPPGVTLCDLDDETEMITNSSKSNDDNQVEFKLNLKDDPNSTVDVPFNKLAIRVAHMRSIKQLLEPTVDVLPKKMHMVSLDNLVSGRRARVRTTKDDGDEIIETPRKGTRKSVRKAAEDSMSIEEETAEDGDVEMKETPSRKRRISGDSSSTSKKQKRTK